MVELESPVFGSEEETVAAGELADGAIVVQVRVTPQSFFDYEIKKNLYRSLSLQITPTCLYLVDGDANQLQQLQVDTNFPIVAASIVDP